MARRLRVASRAAREIRAASRWWLKNRRAAPELLRQELEKAFVLIATEPRVGSPALDTGLERVRRVYLYRVRYHLYYRLGGDDAVEVLAFWHTSRDRGPRLRRGTG